jgi:hypothetical protein
VTDVRAGSRWEGLNQLRAFADARRLRSSAPHCDMCSAAIDEDGHGHVADIANRSLMCVCRPCYFLFTHDGSGGSKFRAVPDRYERIPDADLSADEWERLDIPTGLAFFLRADATEKVTVFYPSPGGATESSLPLDAWDELQRAAPLLRTLLPDVEALLVRRVRTNGGEAHTDALIVPVDVCYELVGRIRQTWRGFQGGDTLWDEIDRFFSHARERATRAS